MQKTIKRMKRQATDCRSYLQKTYLLKTIMQNIQSEVKVVQFCPTLCDPTDYTVLGILQARILEWVAVPFSRGSSQPRDRTQVSHIAGRFFTSWATWEALKYIKNSWNSILRKWTTQLQNTQRHFPDGPVIKTPCSECRRHEFSPWSGNWIPHATTQTQCSQINKK